MYSVSKPNQIFFVGNFDSEEDEGYTITEDSLLSDSVTFAAGTTSTQTTGKRRREAEYKADSRPHIAKPVAHPSKAVPVVPASTGARVTSSTTTPPEPVSGTNAGNPSMVFTSNDVSTFNIADFMKVVIQSIQTTNKVMSKDQESETTKRLRLAETEVMC